MMSDAASVDRTAVDEVTGKLVLVIEETRPWHEPDLMHRQLAAKVKTYVRHIRSSDFFQQYGKQPKDTIVRLVSAERPGAPTMDLIRRIEHELTKFGIEFDYEIESDLGPIALSNTGPPPSPSVSTTQPPAMPAPPPQAAQPPPVTQPPPAAEPPAFEPPPPPTPEPPQPEPSTPGLSSSLPGLEPRSPGLGEEPPGMAETPPGLAEPPGFDAEPPGLAEPPGFEAEPPPLPFEEPDEEPQAPKMSAFEKSLMEAADSDSEMPDLGTVDATPESLSADVTAGAPGGAPPTDAEAEAKREIFPEEEFGRKIEDWSDEDTLVFESGTGKRTRLSASADEPPPTTYAEAAARERPTLWKALLAGFTGALMASLIWPALAVGVGAGVSPVAIGVGFMVGWGIRVRARGSTMTYRIVAVIFTAIGCVFGSALTASTLNAMNSGVGVAGIIANMRDANLALSLITQTYGWLDLLSYALALYLAFRLSAYPEEPAIV